LGYSLTTVSIVEYLPVISSGGEEPTGSADDIVIDTGNPVDFSTLVPSVVVKGRLSYSICDTISLEFG
jgi:hypothetical protein